MKILVDANILTRKQKTGVDYYTQELVFAAARAMHEDTFVLGYYGGGAITIPSDIKNIRLKRIWWLPGRMYAVHRHYLRFVPLELLMPVRADAMLFTDYGCPVTLQKIPKLAVIHDLAYKLKPQHVVASHAVFLDQLVTHTLKNATQIIAISESTKKDVVEQYGYDERKISIVYPAVDTAQYAPASAQEIEQVKAKYGIKGDYLLFLSTLEPRKNVAGIIKAYNILSPELRAKYQLVLAGKKGWLDDEIEELCTKMGERVVRTGRVESSEKAALYTGAKVFTFPSAFEGFGIPILEAMACGTPVITSNVSSMPEVAGDAAVMVDPNDIHDIAAALTKILTDGDLVKELQKQGSKRIKEFTWQKSGQQLVALLRSLVKS